MSEDLKYFMRIKFFDDHASTIWISEEYELHYQVYIEAKMKVPE